METKTPPTETNESKQKWDNLTHGLWQIYEGLSPGDQAELRRGLPSEPFWRLLAYIGREDAHPDALRKWRLLIQCVAISGYADTYFGVALQRAEYSEARLKRPLEAEGDLLPGILRRTARQLRGADQPANWNAARKLLFYTGEHAENARLRIAQQYYTYTDDDASSPNDTPDSDE
jgi:CRISPR type I-E-associated protein CasB/Cse2